MAAISLPCKGGAGCEKRATFYLPTKRYGVVGFCNEHAAQYAKTILITKGSPLEKIK